MTVPPATTPGNVTLVVTAGGGSANSTYTYAGTPTIAQVTPADGPTAGGNTVTINGSGLGTTSSVTFGGTPGTGLAVLGTTQVTATVPAGSAGAVDVVVTTAGGSATATDGFTYVSPPTVTEVTPSSGPPGTAVIISGTGFTGATSVTFGGTPAASFVVTPTTHQINVLAPDHGAGTVDITVTTGQRDVDRVDGGPVHVHLIGRWGPRRGGAELRERLPAMVDLHEP